MTEPLRILRTEEVPRKKRSRDRSRFCKGHEPFLNALVKAGASGLTLEELAGKTGVSQETSRKRRRELLPMGLVKTTNLFRPSGTGRKMTVWVITEAGRVKAHSLRQWEK